MERNTVQDSPMRGKRHSRALACRQKFLRFFPGGFRSEEYCEAERDYKWATHRRWEAVLSRRRFGALLRSGRYAEAALAALRVEQQCLYSMIFSFEKMALRDAVRSPRGARLFAEGLFGFLYGAEPLERRFARWVGVLAALPRRQTRVLTWPNATVFGFIADPATHLFLKPMTTKAAAVAYGYDFRYESAPAWPTYQSLLGFASVLRRDLRDLRPRDMIDIQSFIWVLGSDEYEE